MKTQADEIMESITNLGDMIESEDVLAHDNQYIVARLQSLQVEALLLIATELKRLADLKEGLG